MLVAHTDVFTDILKIPQSAQDAVCVPTNGDIKKNGEAVMGAGMAKHVNRLFHTSKQLGKYLNQFGNRPFYMGVYRNERTNVAFTLFTFPTKHHWWEPSDLELIRRSAVRLVALCDKYDIKNCYLPKVGCGLGQLDWEEQVEPLLKEILDDRFIAVIEENIDNGTRE